LVPGTDSSVIYISCEAKVLVKQTNFSCGAKVLVKQTN